MTPVTNSHDVTITSGGTKITRTVETLDCGCVIKNFTKERAEMVEVGRVVVSSCKEHKS